MMSSLWAMEERKKDGPSVGALVVGVVAGLAAVAWWGISKWFVVAGVAALVAWGISKWFRSSEPEPTISKWFRSFEPEPPKEMSAEVALGAAAGVALAAWGISRLMESTEPEPPHKEKMMKAPGRDYYMPRKDFVENPKAYFRDLHGKK